MTNLYRCTVCGVTDSDHRFAPCDGGSFEPVVDPPTVDGFKVWRVTYTPVDDVVHPSATAAAAARDELSKADPDHSYVIQHASIKNGPTK